MGLEEDIEKIAEQERALRLPQLDTHLAWALGSLIRAMAEERGLSVVIDVRRFGQPLFYSALEGTTPDNPEWVRRKGNVVARYHRSSYGLGLHLKERGQTMEERGHSSADFAAHGGSFPLHVEGSGIVGAVTVSGLPQREDHELVVEALCTLLGRDYNALKLGPETS
jgi:uncharacterized protein (UPF0303 family)